MNNKKLNLDKFRIAKLTGAKHIHGGDETTVLTKPTIPTDTQPGAPPKPQCVEGSAVHLNPIVNEPNNPPPPTVQEN